MRGTLPNGRQDAVVARQMPLCHWKAHPARAITSTACACKRLAHPCEILEALQSWLHTMWTEWADTHAGTLRQRFFYDIATWKRAQIWHHQCTINVARYGMIWKTGCKERGSRRAISECFSAAMVPTVAQVPGSVLLESEALLD